VEGVRNQADYRGTFMSAMNRLLCGPQRGKNAGTLKTPRGALT